ncbi:MLP1_1 [Sanghuangporus weigelae]
MFTLNVILTGHESGKVALFDAKTGEETLNNKHSQHSSGKCYASGGEDGLASHQATIRAYIKVRDTLKTMISRYNRGRALPAATSTQQAGPSSPQANVSVREPTELKKESEEVRTNFEAYRKEMGVGAIKLREVLQYQRESSQLRAAFAKANARIEFPNVRNFELSYLASATQSDKFHCRRISKFRNCELRLIALWRTRQKPESLVEAETSRKHLQERVYELVKQVQTNEEKIAVYERRSSSATGTTGDISRPPAGEDGSEQELKVEVAELRGALKAAEVDLAAARSHVQQFQEIS